MGTPDDLVEEERLDLKGPCSMVDQQGGWAVIRTEDSGRIYSHTSPSGQTHTPLSLLTLDHIRDQASCWDLSSPNWVIPCWDVFGNRAIKLSEIYVPALEENPNLRLVGAELASFGLALVMTDGIHEGGDTGFFGFQFSLRLVRP